MTMMKAALLVLLIAFVDSNFGINHLGQQNQKKIGQGIRRIPSNNMFNGLLPLKPIKPKKKTEEEKKREVKRRLQSVTSIDDFLNTFKPGRGSGLIVHSVNVLGKKGKQFAVRKMLTDTAGRQEQKVVKIIEKGECEPTVKPRDISYLSAEGSVFPSCISYHQCGGCCYNNHVMECVPKKAKDVHTHVFVVYSDWTYETKPFTYQNHTECHCACRIRKEHCTEGQTYDPHNCLCTCRKSVQHCPARKQWSPLACGCVCKNQHTAVCDARMVFNKESCGCVCKDRRTCDNKKKWDEGSCLCVSTD